MRLFKVRKSSDLQQIQQGHDQLQNQLDLNTNRNVSNGDSFKNNNLITGISCINNSVNSANFISETGSIILQQNSISTNIEPLVNTTIIKNSNNNKTTNENLNSLQNISDKGNSSTSDLTNSSNEYVNTDHKLAKINDIKRAGDVNNVVIGSDSNNKEYCAAQKLIEQYFVQNCGTQHQMSNMIETASQHSGEYMNQLLHVYLDK